MQLYPILVVAVLLAADGEMSVSPGRLPFGPGVSAAIAIAPSSSTC